MDPTGSYPDTSAADPWPILYDGPGLWRVLSMNLVEWREVNYQGVRPVCKWCDRKEWAHRGLCRHAREVQAQAPAIEAAQQTTAPKRAA